jgi:hypothetical protein
MSDVAEEHKVAPQYRRNTFVDLPEIGVMRSAIFTPTSASWLNTIKGFFAKLMRRRLKRGVFCPVVELQAAINRFRPRSTASWQRPTPTRDTSGGQRLPTKCSPP